MLTYSTRPRGSVMHALQVCEALTRLEQDVLLLALNKPGDGFSHSPGCPVRLVEAGPAPDSTEALVAQRIEEMAAALQQPDVVARDVLHAQDCLVASALIESRKRNPEEFRATILRTVHHVERFESPYLAECQRRSILEADVLLSVSDETSNAVRAQFGRECQRVRNGVDLKRFATSESDRRRAREILQIEAADFLVLSVGGVEPRKNSLRCLDAVSAILSREPRCRWVVVGGASILDHGEYRARFQARLERLPPDQRSRIELVGSVTEQQLLRYYRASDTLLCPSIQEGFGLCVLEALAAGTPVVASNRPPFTEYLSTDAAQLVNPEHVEHLERSVQSLIDEPALRRELARRGRHLAEGHGWDSAARDHLQIYAATARPRNRKSRNEHA